MEERFRLYNESCIDTMKKLEADSVDLVLTDPPYNLGLFMKQRATNLKAMRENFFGAAGWDDLESDEWERVMDQTFAELARVVKLRGSVLMFMALTKAETIIRLAEKYGFYYKTTGIWHKKNPMPRNMNLHFINSVEAWIYFTYKAHTGTFNNNGKAIHDFIETPVVPAGERSFGKHPTQKPIQLLEHFVKILTNEGDVIYDPFSGSGSSGVAALIHNRKFIGSEINPEYYKNSLERLSAMVC